ncbi:MAG: hypothetical protein QW244_02295 [Candidatus Pacearchaeota archaeon]
MVKKEGITIGLVFLFLFFLGLIILFIGPRITLFGFTQEQNCDYVSGDWIISDINVVCENRNINITGNLIVNGSGNLILNNVTLFVANSVFLQNNAKFLLNESTLSLNVNDLSPTEYNISSDGETNLTLYNSLIKNFNVGKYKINISGYFNLINSSTSNQTEIDFYGNKAIYLINSRISSRQLRFDISRTAGVFANNITFDSPCQTSSDIFNIEQSSLFIINNSIFECSLSVNEYANVVIENSNFDNLSIFKMYSYAQIKNSTFDTLDLSSLIVLNFTTTSNITNKIILSSAIPNGDEPKLYGNLSMPQIITWMPGSDRLIRYYPIYLRDQFGRPLQGWHVNITRNSDNALISEGYTDADGRVELNITFNGTNYASGNFTLSWNGSTDINLLNNTPIIIVENISDNPPYWSQNITNPPSPAGLSNVSFNFSIIWSDELNSTITAVLFENNFTGMFVNLSVLSNCNAINDTSIQCNLSFNLAPGVYTYRWYAQDVAGNTNTSDNWLYQVFDDLPPSIQFVSPTPANNSVLQQNYLQVNVTAQDNLDIATIIIYLYNSSSLVSTWICPTSQFCFYNFTNLPNGIYYFNATANDSSSNSNQTETRQINIDVAGAGGGGGSGGGGGGGGGSGRTCTSNWQCSIWSSCINNKSTRLCIDLNGCEPSKIETTICNSNEKLGLEGCRPIWWCDPWGSCIGGFMYRKCNVSNADDLFTCIYKILPDNLKNLTKSNLIELLNKGELAKYFGSYFEPPLMKKSCGEKAFQEEQQYEIQKPLPVKCIMPWYFFILLALLLFTFLIYLILISKLKKIKDEIKKETEKKK